MLFKRVLMYLMYFYVNVDIDVRDGYYYHYYYMYGYCDHLDSFCVLFFSNVFLWPFVRYSFVASFLLLVLGKVTYTQRYSSGNSSIFSEAAHTFSSAFYLEANACMFFSVLLDFFFLL